jgi:hypothetical protein
MLSPIIMPASVFGYTGSSPMAHHPSSIPHPPRPPSQGVAGHPGIGSVLLSRSRTGIVIGHSGARRMYADRSGSHTPNWPVVSTGQERCRYRPDDQANAPISLSHRLPILLPGICTDPVGREHVARLGSGSSLKRILICWSIAPGPVSRALVCSRSWLVAGRITCQRGQQLIRWWSIRPVYATLTVWRPDQCRTR